MTKTELIQGVQERLDCTKKDAELAVNTVFEVLTDALVHDEKVAISKFVSGTKSSARIRRPRN